MALPERAGHRRSFADARDDGRQMDVTWHSDSKIFVISLWHGATCRSTFRLPIDEAPALISMLASALGDAASVSREPHRGDVVALRAVPRTKGEA